MNSDTSHENDEASRAEECFRLVVESSPAAMVIVDHSGRIALVNKQTENWFGYNRDELIGQEIEVLIPSRFHERHRDDRDGFLAAPQTRPMGAEHELFARRNDGTEFPVDISLHPMQTADGLLVMAHIVDLSDRRQAEAETRRRHAMERLALLGQLAGGVAHEIRNPLGVIRNAAYYLELVRDTLDAEAQESIAEIQREVDRANHIVGDLLDYAREPQKTTIIFDVVERVREVADRQRRALGSMITINTAADCLPVAADPDHIDRILVNLIRNGVQASEDGGQITISLRSHAGTAIIDVSDEGDGIDEQDRLRIFEPLFTTKAKGIGIGLAMSKRYAERNAGRLELVDCPTKGSTFRLTLPLGPSH